MDNTTLIGLAIVGGTLIYLISIYNHLVTLKNRFKNAFAQIDVQLQRRHDLIPNLVESAKSFMQFEQETLQRVMEARAKAVQATSQAAKSPEKGSLVKELGVAESVLNGALAHFYAVSENYPELKSNEPLMQLMEELSSTENKVAFARQAFNDSVMTYHTYREQFPGNLIAGFFAFTPTQLFEVDSTDIKKPVKVTLQRQ